MKMISDTYRKQLLYKLELISHLNRTSVSRSEKFIACLYKYTSDYGTSISRSLLCIFISVLLFSILYWQFGGNLPSNLKEAYNNFSDFNSCNSLFAGIEISLSRTFLFGAFSDSAKLLVDDLHEGSTIFWARVVATFQSLVSISLIFSLGLTLKRKFQMH